MWHWILFLFIALFTSCKQSKPLDSIFLTINNLPVDSCSLRINHIISGKEIFTAKNILLNKPIEIPALLDDVYILVFSWPKTYIPHGVYSSKGFDKNFDEDIFEWTKPFFYSQRNGNNYIINISDDIDLEMLETKGTEVLKILNVDCDDCNLADEYWNLYNSFFKRKMGMLDSVRAEYYAAVDNQNLEIAADTYKKLNELDNQYRSDALLDQEIIAKVDNTNNNSVSTFFLFYQLFMHKDFRKFKSSFEKLNGDAVKSKYYKMIKNQYDKL